MNNSPGFVTNFFGGETFNMILSSLERLVLKVLFFIHKPSFRDF